MKTQVIDLLLQEDMFIKVAESLYCHAEQLDRLAQQLTGYIKKGGDRPHHMTRDHSGSAIPFMWGSFIPYIARS